MISKSLFLLLVLLIELAAREPVIVSSRIVGGMDAVPDKFYYMASLRSNGKHFCGGSIISEWTILTACHCLDEYPQASTIAVVGTNYLLSGGIGYRIHRYIKHYQCNRLNNDIGLVITAVKITFSITVRPIALPPYNIYDGEEVVAIGWGLKRYGDVMLPDTLQYVSLKTISTNDCARRSSLAINSDEQLCTLPGGKGLCSGDTGSPLVVCNQVHGVASAHYQCDSGLPDIYVRVYGFLTWIITNIDKF